MDLYAVYGSHPDVRRETLRLRVVIMATINITPGMRVKVTQSIERREGAWHTEVVGTVVSIEPKPTGSWYAHAKNGKYWLVRLEIEKDDGERTCISLDQNTALTILDDDASGG